VSTTALPAGASCGSCRLFSVCRSHFNRLPEDVECEHAPSLYRAAVPAPRAPVASPRPKVARERPIRHINASEPDRVKLLLRERAPGRFVFGSNAYQAVLDLEGQP
jgi:hypothetical protein